MGLRRQAVELLLLVTFLSGGCGDDASCPEGLSRCRGECVDLESDEQNCGMCDAVCGLNSYCSDAVCVCFPGYHFDGSDCLEGEDPCANVACSGHGVCAVSGGQPICVCDPGYHADGLACLEDPDPCEGITCSGHGQCAVASGLPVCACDPGYHADGLACLEDPDACEGQTCSGHGQCVVQDYIPVCVCDDGYHPEGLACVEDPDPPQIAVAPDALDFGDLHIRDAATLPVTVRNDGEGVLQIDSININGGMDSFSFLPASLPSLSAGDETILQVSFSPSSVGIKEANLELNSDNPEVQAAQVSLAGNAIDPDIFVLPAAPIDLGQVLTGQSSEVNVYIHKAGIGPLQVTDISLTAGSSDFTLVDVPTLPAVLDSEAIPLIFKIRYAPSSVGVENDALQISSSDLDAPVLTLNVIGEGV